MKVALAVFVLLTLAVGALAEEALPNNPTPQISPVLVTNRFVKPEVPAHKFWDRRTKIEFALTAGVRLADAISTCRMISNGGHERWAPFKSCAGASAWIASGQVAQTGLQYLADRTHHYKLKRWIPALMISGNGLALGYTFSHFNVRHTPIAGDSLPAQVGGRSCTATYDGTRWVLACSEGK